MKTKKLIITGLLFLAVSAGINAQAPWPYNIQLGGAGSYNLRGATGVYNTAIGDYSMSSGTGSTPTGTLSGNYNSALGGNSLLVNTSGFSNCAFGYRALTSNTTGQSNVSIGYDAMRLNVTGNGSVAVGTSSLFSSIGTSNNGFNTAVGYQSGYTCTTGNYNTFLGYGSGTSLTTGWGNLILGYVQVPTSASTSTSAGYDTNTSVIMATADSNQKLYIHSNGCAGFQLGNNVIPQNRLVINATGTGAQAGTAGLRFNNYNNTSASITNPTNKVLSLNSSGDVILVDDVSGSGSGTTFTSTCGTNNYVPKATGASSMVCSQIYDNGTSVGIGTTGSFSYTYTAGDDALGVVPSPGTARLRVNGVTWSGGFYATSDKKFKKEIKAIESPLATIQKIEGKTYLWNKEADKEMELDDAMHSGFIAQELEKVLPHLVATDSNGNKAVNYMELMPYLLEAIKEQQIQINDLKTQLSEGFKAQNQDLIQFQNTKIINVSPNPSKDIITVSFNIEKSVQTASIQVFDLSGNQMSILKINDRDTNLTRTLQKNDLGKGIYIVSLVINGKSIDSKKIIFE